VKSLIFDFNQPELASIFTSWGEPSYRTDQVWKGLYQHFWGAPDDFSNLPRSLRLKLGDYFSFSHLTNSNSLSSSDGETREIVFLLPDGQSVETVLMGYTSRRSLCISTQAGCAMGCSFCATGQMGFRRNLTSGEIVEQVLYFSRVLKAEGDRLTNIIVMGMGEPFHNYDATMMAMEKLNQPDGFNLGARRITISTVGLVPSIRKFTLEHRQYNLAISLHAADDNLRSSMLPINRKYPLNELIPACLDYVTQTHRRITFEWALIKDVNDSPEQAQKLVNLISPLNIKGTWLCHINLIPLNPTAGYNGEGSNKKRAQIFKAEMEKHSIPCTIRLRRGIDIQAGCGQLAGKAIST